ncbi:MAG: 2Fe-2S iron-sulfur cluster-binding protein, partial [Gammaproteobacteria bacterium]
MTGYRLDKGGSVDRSQSLRFRFDGRSYQGYAGDTLASALLANGVSIIARSFKYHRPRGLFSAGPEEPNALLDMDSGSGTEPNTKATMIDLYDGLNARSQHCWPSLSFDFLAINNLLGGFFSAGFYYKTFMGPGKKAWMFYERFIRRAAGLGAAT